MKFDLHCHSLHSDGTNTPAELVRMAARAKIGLFALSDHDTMAGVNEAMLEGKKQNITVLPAVEWDCESPFELHMLGLDVDMHEPKLVAALELVRERRERRNRSIIEKLKSAGYDVYDFFEEPEGITTRLHIAKALVSAGYAQNATDAFARFLSPGAKGYCAERRFTPKEVIELVRGANGVPVLAHPCHIRHEPHSLVRKLADDGLMGLEAYYPASTLGQTKIFESLATQFALLVTCGSDFHGGNRQGTPLGCAWRDVSCLNQSYTFFINRQNERLSH